MASTNFETCKLAFNINANIRAALRNVSSLLVAFAKTIQNQDGKDKLLKFIQYFAKIQHLSHKSDTNPKFYATLASTISLTRRTVKLGNWLSQNIIPSIQCTSMIELLFQITDAMSSICDDICCLYRLNIIHSKSLYLWADVNSSRFWLIRILRDIYKWNRKIYSKGECINEEQHISSDELLALIKVYMDFGFCWYCVIEAEFSAKFQQYCGLLAALFAVIRKTSKEII